MHEGADSQQILAFPFDAKLKDDNTTVGKYKMYREEQMKEIRDLIKPTYNDLKL